MREISIDMQARLDGRATFMCRCWLVERRDGTRFGFTDHDRDLTFDGLAFLAGSGMDASVIEVSTGLSVDNAQAVGALSGDSLEEADILAGKFDGATVRHWLVDWQDTALNILLFRGFLGEIRRGKTAFEVELRGIAEELNQPLGRSYLRVCDRIFGDDKCGIDVENPLVSKLVSVTGITAARQVVFDDLSGFPAGFFVNGSIRWANGAVSLIKTDRVVSGDRVLELWEEVRWEVSNGDMGRVIAGCDKRAASCAGKFDNFLNFRGFPHMPGEDWVTSYPKRGEKHDGGKLTGIFDSPLLDGLFDA